MSERATRAGPNSHSRKMIAFAEFSLTCKGVAPTGDVPIYANVNGNIVQVARSKDGSKYQVGWSTEMKLAKTGDYKIR